MPELNLHGFFVDEIDNRIDQFLFENFNNGNLNVKVIYGIGTGRLHDAALKFLAAHPLVEKVLDEGGHCAVLLCHKN
ncbi:MAG: Smr/MutS family protein [Patescibacteria group bacterium]